MRRTLWVWKWLWAVSLCLAAVLWAACGGAEDTTDEGRVDADVAVLSDGASADADAAADALGADADADAAADPGDVAEAGPEVVATVDVAFSQLRAEEITEESALIRFTTSAPVLGSVEYGLSGASLDNVAVDPSADPQAGRTSHSIALAGLSAETSWTVQARGVDALGVLHVSKTLEFSTLASQVQPVTGNVALAIHGTTIAAVSSNFGGLPNGSSKGADKAIDDDLDSFWASNNDGDAAYIELDLGTKRTVARVGLAAYNQLPLPGSGHIQTARVLFDGADSGLGTVSLEDPDALYSFDLPAPVAVRRVRVEAVTTNGGNTGLREVQLFTPDAAP